LGVAENTIIVFASDNGGFAHGPRGKNIMGTGHYTHNWPLRSGKCSAYEGGSRVPMIVSWVKPAPNNPVQERIPIQSGSACHKPVMCDDILPTFCAWAGVEDIPGHFGVFDGEDITGYVTAKKGFKRSAPIILHYPHFINYSEKTLQYGYGPFSAMRRDNWKVIYFYHRKKWELYDLDRDISEKNDLSKENPELLKDLASELINRLRDMGAQYPVLKTTGEEVPPRMPE
ncbi:MAG: sulfatase/phosphatase domain-containing protein, partial [bacterium]